MAMLIQIYFWFMVFYLAASVLAKLLKAKDYAALGNSAAFWLEEIAGYLLLGVGLLGVYGYMSATPYVSASFWKAFIVTLFIFSALQCCMPKMRLLKKEKGTRVVIAASIVGMLMQVPMFMALGDYALSGFAS
jgi:hypothetical protein